MNKKLTKEQYQRLKRWEKRMIVFFTLSMIIIVIAYGAGAVFDFTLMWIITAALIVIIVIPGMILQFSERCPNCDSRLGFQTRLVLPEECKRCHVSFKNPNGSTGGFS